MTKTSSQAKPGTSDRHYLLSFFAHAMGALCVLGFIALRLADLPNLLQQGSTFWLILTGDIMLLLGVMLLFRGQGLTRLRQTTYRWLLIFIDEARRVYEAITHELWQDLTPHPKKQPPPQAEAEDPPSKGYVIRKRQRGINVPETIL